MPIGGILDRKYYTYCKSLLSKCLIFGSMKAIQLKFKNYIQLIPSIFFATHFTTSTGSFVELFVVVVVQL